jgi:hypothetical protein
MNSPENDKLRKQSFVAQQHRVPVAGGGVGSGLGTGKGMGTGMGKGLGCGVGEGWGSGSVSLSISPMSATCRLGAGQADKNPAAGRAAAPMVARPANRQEE